MPAVGRLWPSDDNDDDDDDDGSDQLLNIQSKFRGTDSVPIPTGFENDLGRLHLTNGRSLKIEIGKNSWVVNKNRVCLKVL